MKTAQIMTRKFYNSDLRQNHKTEFFCLTDLLKIGNKYREIRGLKKKHINDYTKLDSTKDFMLSITKKHKIVDLIDIKKGKYGGTWAHPYIMIDMAMWLNPDFKVDAIEFLSDNLIKNRDNSGESYKLMSKALYSKFKFSESVFMVQEVAKRIKQVVNVEDWNNASEQQLKNRDKIHNNIILLSKSDIDIKKVIRLAIEDIYPNYLKGL